MEPLRIGVLGAARIAGLAIVKPASITGDRIVVVAARDRRRAEAFATRQGVERVVDSYDDVVSDPEVEVVYNPLANSLHGPWNLAAIAAGKHVLSEKPFASNADEARDVRDAAATTELTVLEGFHYLYHPVTRRLHTLLDSGELGTLRQVEVVMDTPTPNDDDPRWSLQLAGGALMDLGCYALHAHRMLAPWASGPPAWWRLTEGSGPDTRVWMNGSAPSWSSPLAQPVGPLQHGRRGGCRAGSWGIVARQRPRTSSGPTAMTASRSRLPTALGWSSWESDLPTHTSSTPCERTCARTLRCPSTPTTPSKRHN